jgi:hypothetical protein
MTMTFAGKPFETMEELTKLAFANPKAAVETFTVAGSYGSVAHGHLEIKREGGMGDVDKIGIMAYEDLLVGAIRCVGSDYVEYAARQGVPVDAVRLEVVGTWDVRGMGPVFGLKAPAGATRGWQGILVRATVRTGATRAQAEQATRFAWENNVAAASLSAVPTRYEVAVEAPAVRLVAKR